MLKSLYYAAGAAVAAVEARRPLGRSIYDSDDWDLCIVLDACRWDLWRDVTGVGRPVWSVGSVTTEWLSNTFRPDDVADTTLVSASPHARSVFEQRDWLTDQSAAPVPYPDNPAAEPSDFGGYRPVFEGHAGAHGVVEPDRMARLTAAAADESEGRVVAHWLQPHEPFVAPDAEIVGGAALADNVWSELESGDVSERAVWQSYQANLEHALEYVREVVAHVDGRVLVTSDHGNAFGEWGQHGHPAFWPQPAVRRVPWWLTDGGGRGQLDTDVSADGATNREIQLAALGYA
jgi:hypothetical protein